MPFLYRSSCLSFSCFLFRPPAIVIISSIMVLKNSGVLATIRAVALSLLLALKPSFLHRNSTSNKPRRIYRTSYLDGLRGVAALFVVIAHYEATYFPFLAGAFHEGKPKEAREKRPPPRPSNNNLLQLPIVRTIYSGPFMVSIFFVISGYVLSQKALGESATRLLMGCWNVPDRSRVVNQTFRDDDNTPTSSNLSHHRYSAAGFG